MVRRKSLDDDARPVARVDRSRASGLNIPTLGDGKFGRLDILAALEKKYGAENIQVMSEEMANKKRPVLPTGSLRLDRAIGGGWPFSRIVEVYGPPGGGKTTVVLQAIAACHKLGGRAAFLNLEYGLDASYARRVGCQTVGTSLLVAEPENGEQALSLTEDLVKSGAFGIIVLDSAAAIIPEVELTGDVGDAHVGGQARLLSTGLKRLVRLVARADNCILFLVNQLRTQIGAYGNPERSTGGNAPKFYASVRVAIRAGQKLAQPNEPPYGQKISIQIDKSRFSAPNQKIERTWSMGRGSGRPPKCWTSRSRRAPSRRRAPGTRTRASGSVRAASGPPPSSRPTPSSMPTW